MKWEMISPNSGDMVRVKSGRIYHYGVFVSDSEVIQFGLAPIARQGLKDSDIEVCASDVDTFLQGGFLEVAVFDKKEARKRIKPSESVRIARSRLGEHGYNILYNNCEHFAYQCVTGEKKCTQTDDTRKMFQDIFANMLLMRVYTAVIPECEISEAMLDALEPASRAQEIRGCSNPVIRRQKYYAWRLLEHALKDAFGYEMQSLKLSKNQNGKWVCPSCFFSISHSGDAVAVAVGRCAVGVDIQILDIAPPTGFGKRILTPSEEEQLYSAPERNRYLLTKWSEKESIFKSLDQKHFKPSELSTAEHPTLSRIITVCGKEYALSVTGKYKDRISFHEYSF